MPHGNCRVYAFVTERFQLFQELEEKLADLRSQSESLQKELVEEVMRLPMRTWLKKERVIEDLFATGVAKRYVYFNAETGDFSDKNTVMVRLKELAQCWENNIRVTVDEPSVTEVAVDFYAVRPGDWTYKGDRIIE